LCPSSPASAAANKDTQSCLSCPAGDVDTKRLQSGASCGVLDSRCGSGSFYQATSLPRLMAGKDWHKPEYPREPLSW